MWACGQVMQGGCWTGEVEQAMEWQRGEVWIVQLVRAIEQQE